MTRTPPLNQAGMSVPIRNEACRPAKAEVPEAVGQAREPYFVVSIHFDEQDKDFQDRIFARFDQRICHRLRSHAFLPNYIQLGIKTFVLSEAIEIANEYANGFEVRTEIAVEGWEARSADEGNTVSGRGDGSE